MNIASDEFPEARLKPSAVATTRLSCTAIWLTIIVISEDCIFQRQLIEPVKLTLAFVTFRRCSIWLAMSAVEGRTDLPF